MALRIGGGKPPVEEEMEPSTEEMPDELEALPDTEPMPEDTPVEDSVEDSGGGILDPVTAGYRGPDQGPFMCGNCEYFSPAGEANTCLFVSGTVDEGGLCNLFTARQAEEVSEDVPVEEPVDEALPDDSEEPLPAEE